MKTNQIREVLSWVPLFIRPYFGVVELAVGTAFLYRHNDKIYLITNWHNVTGREPVSHKTKHSQCAVPDELVIAFPKEQIADDGRNAVRWTHHRMPLYEDSDHNIPVWFEHPVHADKIDVVAIPIEGVEEIASKVANDPKVAGDKIAIFPGFDVFVLGYPRGISGGGRFPIWKRGSIATEPDFDIGGLPMLLIDTATREGMSGAPVFIFANGTWFADNTPGLEGMTFGVGKQFLGVYSGRLGDDVFQAQLGVVWKEQAIIEVIEGGKIGVSSFGL
jgi:hypothetical protein